MANLQKGTRISGQHRDAVRAEIKQKYEEGKSIRSIAADLERSYGFVHRVLTEAGVTLRRRGGATRGRSASG